MISRLHCLLVWIYLYPIPRKILHVSTCGHMKTLKRLTGESGLSNYISMRPALVHCSEGAILQSLFFCYTSKKILYNRRLYVLRIWCLFSKTVAIYIIPNENQAKCNYIIRCGRVITRRIDIIWRKFDHFTTIKDHVWAVSSLQSYMWTSIQFEY